MPDTAEMQEKFWKALKSDRTLMLGLAGVEDGLGQPMTAQVEDGQTSGPIYFFTSSETDLVDAMGQRHRATGHFADKGHELFAAIDGELILDNDKATIDRLWNRYVAAWFEGGRDDPKVTLLRFEPDHAQIWLNAHSLIAGVKVMLGRDPKEDFKDKTAEVRLS